MEVEILYEVKHAQEMAASFETLAKAYETEGRPQSADMIRAASATLSLESLARLRNILKAA